MSKLHLFMRLYITLMHYFGNNNHDSTPPTLIFDTDSPVYNFNKHKQPSQYDENTNQQVIVSGFMTIKMKCITFS